MLVITYLGFNDYKVSRDFKGVFYIDLNVPLHCDYVESYPVVFWAIRLKNTSQVEHTPRGNEQTKNWNLLMTSYTVFAQEILHLGSWRRSKTMLLACHWDGFMVCNFPNWSGGGIKDAISNYKQCFYKHLQRTFVRRLWCWIQVLSETRIQLAQFHFISASGAS